MKKTYKLFTQQNRFVKYFFHRRINQNAPRFFLTVHASETYLSNYCSGTQVFTSALQRSFIGMAKLGFAIWRSVQRAGYAGAAIAQFAECFACHHPPKPSFGTPGFSYK